MIKICRFSFYSSTFIKNSDGILTANFVISFYYVIFLFNAEKSTIADKSENM